MNEHRGVIMPQERDLSRAEWQRSIGMVVLSHLCDIEVSRRNEIPVQDIVAWAESLLETRRMYMGGYMHPWPIAYGLSIALRRMGEGHSDYHYSQDLTDNAAAYTFTGSMYRTFVEGLDAQCYFPLNMARIVQQSARDQEVTGYELSGVADVAQLFRSDPFLHILGQCAFTRNGVWRDMTSRPSSETHQLGNQSNKWGSWIQFDSGAPILSPQVTQILSHQLAKNNHNPAINHSISSQSSSGCPVNHTVPHPSTAQTYSQELDRLSAEFGVTVEHLLRRRKHTPIADLTLQFADVLDKAQQFIDPPTSQGRIS